MRQRITGIAGAILVSFTTLGVGGAPAGAAAAEAAVYEDTRAATFQPAGVRGYGYHGRYHRFGYRPHHGAVKRYGFKRHHGGVKRFGFKHHRGAVKRYGFKRHNRYYRFDQRRYRPHHGVKRYGFRHNGYGHRYGYRGWRY